MARAWVVANRNLTAVVVIHHGRVQRCYRDDEFPWLAIRRGEPISEDPVAAGKIPIGTYSEIEEVDPEVWLSERDAKRTLELTEQVLAERDGYALVLLQIEFDDEYSALRPGPCCRITQSLFWELLFPVTRNTIPCSEHTKICARIADFGAMERRPRSY